MDRQPNKLKSFAAGLKRGVIRTGQAIQRGTVAVGRGIVETGKVFGKRLRDEMEYRKQLSRLEKEAYRQAMFKERAKLGRMRAKTEIQQKISALRSGGEKTTGFNLFSTPKIDVSSGFKPPNVEFGFKPTRTKKRKNPLEWV